MTVRRAQQLLRRIGWPLEVDGVAGPQTRRAIKDFQRGWFGRRRFRVAHGYLSRYTQKALEFSASHGGVCGSRAPHFTFREWKSRSSGGCRGNGWIRVRRELVAGLERYRRQAGQTVIVSGYRDPVKNACVGGVGNSQHLYGNAADLVPRLTVAQVRSLGAFSGIGYQRSTGLVRHVDVRHMGPNTTGGTPRNPTVWQYSG